MCLNAQAIYLMIGHVSIYLIALMVKYVLSFKIGYISNKRDVAIFFLQIFSPKLEIQ